MFTNDVSADIDKILQTQIIEMGGNDPLLGQIVAFEKLLRHAISRFSKERLYAMLKVVSAEQKTMERYPRAANTAAEANKPSTAQDIKLKSVRQVRAAIKNIEKREQKEKLSDQERNALKYFETFDNDLSYLSNLKNYFDEEVHGVLLVDYFDPADKVTKPTTTNGSRSNGREKTKQAKTGNKTTKKPTEDDQYNISDKARLCEVVKELKEIQAKWGNLLADKDLDVDDFDPDSYHELMQFSNVLSIEPVLRLVPDIFVKCYKSVDVAREWWTLAQSIYKDRLPLKSKRPVKKEGEREAETKTEEEVKSETPEAHRGTNLPEMQESDIKKNLSDIGMYIKEHEKELESLNEEVKVLEKRESRIDFLTSEFEQMDNRLQDAKKEYNHFLLERQRTMDKIKKVSNTNTKQHELTKKENSLNFELTKHQNKLKMLEYEKAMVQEDYLLELEIRPTFIHFTGDLKLKIEELRSDIAEKQAEKQRLEKELELLRTNTGKTNKDQDDSDSKTISRQITRLTKEIEDDLQNLEDLESDRTFVSESDDVDLAEYISAGKSRDSLRPQPGSIKPDSRTVTEKGRLSKNSTGKAGNSKAKTVYSSHSTRVSKSTAKVAS